MPISSVRRAIFFSPVLFTGAAFALTTTEEPGVTHATVTIGRLSPQSSELFSAMARQRADGADVCIAYVNANGGIAGRRIVVKERDDGYSADRALVEVESLIESDKIFALLGAFGTPTLPVVMNAAESRGVPLIGAANVSDDARHPPRRYVFPVRASSLDEADAIVKHQTTVGVKRFVVLSCKEAFGPAGASAYATALGQQGLAAPEIRFSAASGDPRLIAKKLIEAQPEAILLSVLPGAYAAVAREYIRLGGRAVMLSLSVMRIDDLRVELGPFAAGVVLAQPLPSPFTAATALSHEYRQLMSLYKPTARVSYYGLEGFLEAKIFVEGLKRAGERLTKERFVSALESMIDHDFGGLVVRYGKGVRTGSTFVELVMLHSDGSIVR